VVDISSTDRDREIASNGLTNAIKNTGKGIGKIATKVVGKIVKKLTLKFLGWLLAVLAPYWVPILVAFLCFIFVYGSFFMLPKYIALGTGTPVVYNYGQEDVWSLEQDIELVNEYKELDRNWTNQFEDFYTLAYKKPDNISGNGADNNATVKDVWGSYMAISTVQPLNMPQNIVFDDIFQAKAQKYNLDFELLKAVAWAESSFDPRAVSSANCKGLMQLSDSKIKEYGINDPFDPEQNIDGGARYLRYLLDRYNGNTELALAAYNAGPGAVDQYNGIPPYSETTGYVAKIMAVLENGSVVVPTLEEGSNIMSEQEQINQHRVNWAILGALDRVLGDPIIHGKHGIETIEDRGRIPKPEEHFDILEPELEWENFELYYYHRWTETETNEDGEEVTKTYREEYRHNINLLTYVDSYEAKYHYSWQEKVIEDEDEDEYTKIIVPELESVKKEGPYFIRLENLLSENGLSNPNDLEFVLRLAMNMDEDFYIDANLSSSLIELIEDTEDSYYRGSGDLTWPVRGRITSYFGWRVHPVLKERRFHTGIDIACPRGTEIKAAGDGIVIFVGNNAGYGKCVIIDHGDYRTMYAHLLSYEVTQGEEVSQGQLIAKADSTGISTGDHLHFEVRTKEGEYIDPLTILN